MMGASFKTAALGAVVAVVCGVVADLVANAPRPSPGKAITPKAYGVKVDWLRESRTHWAHAREAVHVAAAALANGTFVRSAPDESLAAFVAESASQTATPARRAAKRLLDYQLFWSLQRYLGWSRPDASGFVGMKRLYVASEAQFRAVAGGAAAARLLDVGSGTGSETAKVAAALAATDVVCLETSRSMRRHLEAKGFAAAAPPLDIADADAPAFAAAALLNVLDRCDDPAAVLDAALAALEPGGLLLVATVLPFSALVHEGRVGSTWGVAASRKPRRPLAMHAPASRKGGVAFESGAAAFLEALTRRHPTLALERWTRLPYVSTGDLRKTHYTLDVALLALRRRKTSDDDDGRDDRDDDKAPGGHAAGGASSADDGAASSADDGGAAIDDGATAASSVPRGCRGKSGDKIFAWLSDALVRAGGAWAGDVLDAGAGLGSTCWLAHQPYTSLTAVTASAAGTDAYGDRLRDALGDAADVVVGNWRDDAFLADAAFDVVVADYLVGASDLHWPHGANRLLDRLLAAVRPGGALLVVGLEPYDLLLDRDADAHSALVLDVEALGDGAALLAGERTYREVPEAWLRAEIARRPDFAVVAADHFPMKLTARSLNSQLAFAAKMARKVPDAKVRDALLARAAKLEADVSAVSTVRRGRNYAMVVRRSPQ